MKRAPLIVTVLLLLCLAAGGWVGYAHYRTMQLHDAVVPHVKNASLRLDDLLQVGSSSMTYAELFRKIDDHLKALDTRSLDLRSMNASASPELVAAADRYLKWVQETMRRHAAMYRDQLQVQSAEDWFSQSLRSTTSGSYSDHAIRRLRDDHTKITEAYEKLLTAMAIYGLALTSAPDELAAARQHFDAAHLVAEPLVSKASEAHHTAFKEAQRRAELQRENRRRFR